ncbi:MAG: septum formation initiator family protein [Wolbachia endosymbiont of Meromenopon meropis]|nr:septum formation initiator family protein [Wolbachia endosymbiont of Meromenopon meropis]
MSVILLIFFLTIYFSINTITGKRGLSALINLKKEIESSQFLLKKLSLKKEKLSNKVFGLYEKSLDLDLFEEQVKNALGCINSKELMIIPNVGD